MTTLTLHLTCPRCNAPLAIATVVEEAEQAVEVSCCCKQRLSLVQQYRDERATVFQATWEIMP